MKLNQLGKRRLFLFITITIVFISIAIYLFIQGGEIAFFGFVLLIEPLVYPTVLMALLAQKLEDSAFQSLGFSPVTKNKSDVSDFQTFKKGAILQKIYAGSYQNQHVSLVQFFWKNFYSKEQNGNSFIGLLYDTSIDMGNVEIYDAEHPLISLLQDVHELESVEFNKAFKIYSEQPQAPFYLLDPSIMHNLLELRGQLNNQINIEAAGKKVLIYTTREYFNRAVMGSIKLNLLALLNTEDDPQNLKIFQQRITHLLNTCQKIFTLLNIQPK